MNKYSHIDLTVNSWEKVRDFYEHLLPALGFTRIEDGPRLFPISPTHYAVFFRDPCGNRFEMLHRLN